MCYLRDGAEGATDCESEIYYAITAGVETELVIYPRERHSIQEYLHRVDVQKRMLAWFNKHLK